MSDMTQYNSVSARISKKRTRDPSGSALSYQHSGDLGIVAVGRGDIRHAKLHLTFTN
ncbi:hydroxymethylpyrimidine ABC transporter, transmembrane component [Vibrio sp. JCM 19053]|nr:hydroxymethylpyrimidine ABC transporter, transmembrane component [Vibrio sp. JCM 19053]